MGTRACHMSVGARFSGRWLRGDVGPSARGQPTRLRATGFLARSLGLISPSRGPVRHLPPPGNSQLSHVWRSCVAARPMRPVLQPGRASRWRRRPARLALARDEWWAAIDSLSPARGAVRGASRLCNVRASYSPLTLRILAEEIRCGRAGGRRGRQHLHPAVPMLPAAPPRHRECRAPSRHLPAAALPAEDSLWPGGSPSRRCLRHRQRHDRGF